MRVDQKYHYFTKDEVRLLSRLRDDMKTTLKCNPQTSSGQFPTQRVREWATHIDWLLVKKGRELV